MRVRAWLVVGFAAFFAAASCGGGDSATPPQTRGSVVTGSGGASSSSSSGAGGSATTTSSGAGGAGGSGGGALVCPPSPPYDGTPIIDPPDHQWVWVDVAGAKCRDGSPTGFGARINKGATKFFIYLEGGGACFNGPTCAISAANFAKPAFDAWAGTVGQTGIFDAAAVDNPVKDWSAIYVPYCTGDVHAGDATNADVFGGPKGQDFVGYANMGLHLQRLVPTFKSATQVLLTGISAGGFGAALNYDRVATAFCPTPVTLLDDSGPPMSDGYLAPCLQKQWRSLWNLQGSLPPDCAACTGADGGGIVNYVTYLAKKWPTSSLGLVSSTQDSVISTFFGYGTDDCTSSTPLPGSVYAAGLDELRKSYLSASGLWGTYFVDSVTHTYLLGPGFYTTVVNGTKLTTWVGDLLAGKPGNVGP